MKKMCLDCKVEKDISEFYKNRCYCKNCISIRNKLYYESNSDKVKQATRRWAVSNKEKVNAYKKAWANKNYERELQRKALYREKNKVKALKYYQINKQSYIVRNRNREISKLKRTPAWLSEHDKKYIEYIYNFSKNISEYLGKSYHVDHIIPLQGKLVSGLHVPSNLQVIPATINLQKGNKWQIY